MVMRHVEIEGAYTTLGLKNGASADEVKLAYKRLAMKTHPDKNPDTADATQNFQEVGEAYNILKNHFEGSKGHNDTYRYEFNDDDRNYEPSNFHFFMDIDGIFFTFGAYGCPPPSQFRNPGTNAKQFSRTREEQKAAKKRRTMDEQRRKERIKEEEEQERLAAEKRQKQQKYEKKALKEAARKDATEKILNQQKHTQILRSAVFTAARRGDAKCVKRGVWEDQVDAAGGEIKRGSDAFVQILPKDPAETLLHIAASQGDADLVEWLVKHNAEVDEHNPAGLTAFHIALQKGYLPIVQYFFKHHPTEDEDNRVVYATPPSTTLLRLSIESSKPELVWMVLQYGLANKKEINDAWSWVCSNQGKAALNPEFDEQGFEEVENLLMTYGGFTPPPSPKVKALNVEFENDTNKVRPSKLTIDSQSDAECFTSPIR